jgi:putative oxidoreductase
MASPTPPAVGSLIWYAGLIEIVGGVLLILGLLTRLVALIVAGEMAFAYFIGHSPRSIYPIQNGGNLAILYCFVFLYLMFSGPGPWSVDAKRFTHP